MRCISSRVRAPVAAVSVLQVWRIIVETKSGQADLRASALPHDMPVRAAQQSTLLAYEDAGVVFVTDVAREVLGELGDECGGDAQRAVAGLRFGAAVVDVAVVSFDERLVDGDETVDQVDVRSLQRRQLTKAQTGESCGEHERPEPSGHRVGQGPHLSERCDGTLRAAL